jgi:hypothetical protein
VPSHQHAENLWRELAQQILDSLGAHGQSIYISMPDENQSTLEATSGKHSPSRTWPLVLRAQFRRSIGRQRR